jgi:hypothetical protein
VAKALLACLSAHLAVPYSWRWSDARKAFLDVAECYAAMANLSQRRWPALPPLHLDPRFKGLPQLSPPPEILGAKLAKSLAPFGDASSLRRLARAARRYADACDVDKGGRPTMIAFNMLCLCLAEAFEDATKMPATITRNEASGKWGGKFFRLVEALWPVARKAATALSAQEPLRGPSNAERRGKQIQRLLRNFR